MSKCLRASIYIVLASLYFYGLLLSDGALSITVPRSYIDATISINDDEVLPNEITVLRSLPHLRTINTLHYHKYRTTREREEKAKQSEVGMERNEKVKKVNHHKNENLAKNQNNSTMKDQFSYTTKDGSVTQVTFADLWGPVIFLMAFTLSCRILLAILIYRQSNQNEAVHFTNMGQISRRRTQNRSNFWEIFRTIPIRTRDDRNTIQSRRAHARISFLTIANRLNEQRVANGSQPMSLQALALLFSNRDFTGTDYDELWQVQNENGPAFEDMWQHVGASEEEINRCPVRTLGNDDDLVQTGNCDNDTTLESDERTKCAICLEIFESGDSIRTIPCFHSFHTHCLDPWLRIKAICPICKHHAIG